MKDLVTTRVPRTNGQGLFVNNAHLNGKDVFRVAEFPAWIMCIDPVKEFIQNRQFTNITFFEMGEVT
ncbi:MAG TPA: hypothetical protein VFR78_07655 [Pyrinomonadaceae bacterium]|nr:hypothetical protein [Pyrinomonadaceae bacterium]